MALDTDAVNILLVDDEERMLGALRRGLTAEGFVVDSATNGVDGLQLAQHGDFDAIVLDVMLPGMSGYEVVRRLRAENNWVPVLMLSAKDGEHDQADGLDLGADDYLTKPFSYVVLVARLRALVRRGPDRRPSVLEAGDLRLDPATRLVTRLGQVGYPGKGIALGVVGGLFVWAALTFDPEKASGLDGALRTILDAPFGQFLLTLVALGIAAFGAYLLVRARYPERT